MCKWKFMLIWVVILRTDTNHYSEWSVHHDCKEFGPGLIPQLKIHLLMKKAAWAGSILHAHTFPGWVIWVIPSQQLFALVEVQIFKYLSYNQFVFTKLCILRRFCKNSVTNGLFERFAALKCYSKYLMISVYIVQIAFKDICYEILSILKCIQYFAYILFYARAINLWTKKDVSSNSVFHYLT